MARYTIDSVTPTFLTTKAGLPQKGYTIKFTILEYDEEHTIDSVSNDPDVIGPLIEAEIDKRDRLAQLGA